MIWTITIIAVVWIVAAILFFPFIKKYIQEHHCNPNCSDCDSKAICHAIIGFFSLILAPFLPFMILWWFTLKPASVVAGHYIRKLHTWEMSVAGNVTNTVEEKKEKKKKEKEAKDSETIKSLKKKNKELLKKVAELNEYERAEILDLEE